jgi:ABC-type transport system involved in cytochrome bd biosynthesis fused ATPase/permease subunit
VTVLASSGCLAGWTSHAEAADQRAPSDTLEKPSAAGTLIAPSRSPAPRMQPLKLILKGFRGIRDGLGRDDLTIDFESLGAGAQLVALVGPNGSGKTTIIDNAHPLC